MEKSDSLYFAPVCPHLGMKHDPGTSFAYPSQGNYCRHCRPPAVPTLVYQGAYCLSDAHKDCLAYQQPADQAFPFPFKAKGHSRRKPIARTAALLLGALLLVFAGWWMFSYPPASKGDEAAPLAVQTTPIISRSRTPVSSQTPLVPPSKTPSAPTRTAAHSPTVMSTSSQQVRALEFPLKVGEHSYVLHRIREGENFEVLEAMYVTSAEAILALNYSLSSPLWANSVIVISPGLQTVDLELPAFRPYEVTAQEIPIDELAQQLNVDPALLRYYNNCSDNCLVAAGDWLIVPYIE
jgi:hypothetical protein